MRVWWKKSCHCGLHLSTNAVVNILASETGTKCSNQSEGRALNQLRFKLVKGLDKGIVNVMSNCVSTCPTSSTLAGRLMCLRLVCALFLNEDTTGWWRTSLAPDCCDTSSSPLCPLCRKLLEVTFNVIWCTTMMIDSFVNLIVLKCDITCELHYN